MVDFELIHRLEILVVRHLEDGVCDVLPDNIGNPLCKPLLDANFRNAEDVIPISFVLRIAVVRNLWFDSAVVSAYG